jgi:ligand-binding sensor domain-containing protein/two-component sensor histidine kinase
VNRLPLILILILSCGIAPLTVGSQIRLSKSTLSRLIDQPVISAIYRDKLEFLWIGTQEGLYKFDGANLTIFNSDEDNENWIPSSDIRDISVDYDGTLLIATYGGGLLHWDYASNSFASKGGFSSVDDLQITNLCVAKNGSIWLSTKDKLVLYSLDIEDETWLKNAPALNEIGRPYALAETEAGELVVGSSLGLYKISLDSKSVEQFDLSPLGGQDHVGVTALLFDGIGNLIIGTDNGLLALFDLEKRTFLAQKYLGIDSQRLVTDLSIYKGKLLIATDKGLYVSELNLTALEDISLQGTGLSSSDILTLYSDNDYTWVGTYNGLDILSLAPFELLNSINSGINNDILRFAQDNKGQMWVGTYDGLFLYDDITKSHIRYEKKFPSAQLIDQRITALFSSGSNLWVGFYAGGLQAIDIESGAYTTPVIRNASNISVMDIYENGEAENLWVATRAHGLIRIDSENTNYYYENGLLPEKGISIIFDNVDSLFFVSTTNKVYEYDAENDKFSLLNFDFGFSGNKTVIFSMSKDVYGNIWFGTKGQGMFQWTSSSQRYRNLELKHMGENSILEYSTIYGIVFDSAGNLWSATQGGIVKANSQGEFIKRFTAADGLQGGDFTFGASFTSKERLIYFGGVNGYNRFDPTKIDIDNSPSPMRLTGISLPRDGGHILEELTELKTLSLTHNDRFVTFQFSVLDFIDPEKNEFRYMLENFDADWIENGTRNTATYTNLPPGDYVFRVQGSNSAGIWNRKGITLNLQVLPPLWLSWWAYLIYSIMLMFVFWGLIRIYHSYVIDRKSAEQALQMFEAENKADDDMQEQLELQDEMVQAAYEHSLTTLSLVRDCISYRSEYRADDVKNDLTESSIRRISALSSLEDCISFHAGGAFANLQKYTDGIFPSLFDYTSLRPENTVTINDVTSMPISVELASPISIILYELLENCFQHAFEPGSLANYIHVKLEPETTHAPVAHFLNLTVHDSGIGIPDSIESLVTEGSGIAIVESIVLRLDGKLKLTGKRGTTVSIKIPNRS